MSCKGESLRPKAYLVLIRYFSEQVSFIKAFLLVVGLRLSYFEKEVMSRIFVDSEILRVTRIKML